MVIDRLTARLRNEGISRTAVHAVHRLHTEFWERRLSIRTNGIPPHDDISFTDPNSRGYSPSSYLDFRRAMHGIIPSIERDVFLDLGSGMGRVVLHAATYPFRMAIGVEFSAKLHRIALGNLERARSRLVCPDVRFELCNAALYEIPGDVSIVYLYNPFMGEVLEHVVENLRRSLEARPRAMTVICASPDRFAEALGGGAWLRKIREFVGLRRYVIYEGQSAGHAAQFGNAGSSPGRL